MKSVTKSQRAEDGRQETEALILSGKSEGKRGKAKGGGDGILLVFLVDRMGHSG